MAERPAHRKRGKKTMMNRGLTETCPADIILVARAAARAVERHRDQRRPDPVSTPYANHLCETAELTAELGGDVVSVCAAWLHDVIEDRCPDEATVEAERKWIREALAPRGDEILAVVAGLTDPPEWSGLPKERRKELQAEKIRGKDRRTRLVKICDQISNARATAIASPKGWMAKKTKAYLLGCEKVVAAAGEGIEDAASLFRKAASEAFLRLDEEEREERNSSATRGRER